MSDHIAKTIAEMMAKVDEAEKEVVQLKQLVNLLCEQNGAMPVYHIEDSPSVAIGAIRSDQFYGQPLATCISTYLEGRKAANLGAASVSEIHDALEKGGYHFETKSADNAKRNLRISLAKNTAKFHKLPNGRFGLLEWYPQAKQPKDAASPNESDESAKANEKGEQNEQGND
jgi:hypothetical protein